MFTDDGTIEVDCTDYSGWSWGDVFSGLEYLFASSDGPTFQAQCAAVSCSLPIVSQQNSQALEQCLSNVAVGYAANLGAFQAGLAAATTINDMASFALTAGISLTAGYQAASIVILAGTVATFSEALTTGALAAAGTYVALSLAGVLEGVIVDQTDALFDGLATMAYNYVASSQAAGCYAQWGPQ